MRQTQAAKLLRIHISDSDRRDGKPLYEAIVARCRELEIAGATVFRGLEGFGDTAELHKPIVIVVVDSEEKLGRLLSDVEPMIDTGLISITGVQAVRVRHSA